MGTGVCVPHALEFGDEATSTRFGSPERLSARTGLRWSSPSLPVLAACWSSSSTRALLVETMELRSSALRSPRLRSRLPIGISFFTFQALSYVIDVYRGVVKVQRNFFYVLLYISFFPQLIAGPIVKYRDIQDMIIDRRQDVSNIARGFRRFICGLAKKVLIAVSMDRSLISCIRRRCQSCAS